MRGPSVRPVGFDAPVNARRRVRSPTMNPTDPQFRADLAADIVKAAYLEGDFVLSSGARSNFYFDKYLFETKPWILGRVAAGLAAMLPEGLDRVAGPELGAVALASAVSLQTNLPFVIVRKKVKGYGTDRAVEGELQPGERVMVVEDIVSTGTEAIRAAQRLRELDVTVEGILAVIDRQQGGAENVEEAGFRLLSLFTRDQLGV